MVQNELKGWVVAVIGGDLRMLEHMRQARLCRRGRAALRRRAGR